MGKIIKRHAPTLAPPAPVAMGLKRAIRAPGDNRPVPPRKQHDTAEDLVRVYLTQMGQIPRLTPEEELHLAQKMEEARACFRESMVGSDFVLHGVVGLLQKILQGRLRIDRSLEIASSVPRARIKRDIESTIKRVTVALRDNRADFLVAVSIKQPSKRRRSAWQRIVRRRSKAVQNVEKLRIRHHLLQSLSDNLLNISARMNQLRTQIKTLTDMGSTEAAVPPRRELRRWMSTTLESRTTLARRVGRIVKCQHEYDTAKRELAAGNLRLVVSVAKRYRVPGMSFLDLVQEGNAGLMRAADKFSHDLGFRFSTYATWWIRQGITRAVAEKSRTIRIPNHMVEAMKKMRVAARELVQEHGYEPSVEQTAEAAGLSIDDTRRLMKSSREPLSLDQPVRGQDESSFGDYLEDRHLDDPLKKTNQEQFHRALNDALQVLNDRERQVVQLRYGLSGGRAHTLEEVGKKFLVTRERIRQIECNAMRKLQRNRRIKDLTIFLDLADS